MPAILTSPLSDGRIYKSIVYMLGLVQLRLYGIQYGPGLRASRVLILNRGSILLGNNVSLISYPEGTPYTCSLRTYFAESRIEIGNNCLVNGAVLHSNCSIRLGNHVLLGPGVIIADNDSHPPVQSDERYTQRAPEAPIRLMDRVWIGMRSTVMKGVTVGENTIVAAGSIVTRDLPANVLAAGIPARPLRDLPGDMAELKAAATANIPRSSDAAFHAPR